MEKNVNIFWKICMWVLEKISQYSYTIKEVNGYEICVYNKHGFGFYEYGKTLNDLYKNTTIHAIKRLWWYYKWKIKDFWNNNYTNV